MAGPVSVAGQVCDQSILDFCDGKLSPPGDDEASQEADMRFMNCVLHGKHETKDGKDLVTGNPLIAQFIKDPLALTKILHHPCVRLQSMTSHYVKKDGSDTYELQATSPEAHQYLSVLGKAIQKTFGLQLSDVLAPRFAIADSFPVYLHLTDDVDGKRLSADQVVAHLQEDLQRAKNSGFDLKSKGVTLVFRDFLDRDRKNFPQLLSRIGKELQPLLLQGVPVSLILNYNPDNPEFKRVLMGEVDAASAGSEVVIQGTDDTVITRGNTFFAPAPKLPTVQPESEKAPREFVSAYPADKGIKQDLEGILQKKTKPLTRLQVDVREPSYEARAYYRTSEGNLLSSAELVRDLLAEIVTRAMHAKKIVFTFPTIRARKGYEQTNEVEQITKLYKDAEAQLRSVLAAHPDLQYVNPRVEFKLQSEVEIEMKRVATKEYFSFDNLKKKFPDDYKSPHRFFYSLMYVTDGEKKNMQTPAAIVPVSVAAEQCLNSGAMVYCAQNHYLARYLADQEILEGTRAAVEIPFSLQYYRPNPAGVISDAENLQTLQDFYADPAHEKLPKEVLLTLKDAKVAEQRFAEFGEALEKLPLRREIALRFNFTE